MLRFRAVPTLIEAAKPVIIPVRRATPVKAVAVLTTGGVARELAAALQGAAVEEVNVARRARGRARRRRVGLVRRRAWTTVWRARRLLLLLECVRHRHAAATAAVVIEGRVVKDGVRHANAKVARPEAAVAGRVATVRRR